MIRTRESMQDCRDGIEVSTVHFTLLVHIEVSALFLAIHIYVSITMSTADISQFLCLYVYCCKYYK